MNAAMSDDLQIQALRQRDRIHQTALELIGKVDQAKEQLNLSHNVRAHFGATALLASAITFLAGYLVGAVSKNS